MTATFEVHRQICLGAAVLLNKWELQEADEQKAKRLRFIAEVVGLDDTIKSALTVDPTPIKRMAAFQAWVSMSVRATEMLEAYKLTLTDVADKLRQAQPVPVKQRK